MFEVVPYEDAKRRQLAQYESITTMQTPVIRGGATRDLLELDLSFIQSFYNGIEPHPEGRRIDVFPNRNNADYLVLRNFPLPDGFVDEYGQLHRYQPDYENIVVVIPDYPEVGPRGVHVKKDSAWNLNVIKQALKGHIYQDVVGGRHDLSGLRERGWQWICFHYTNDEWKFNTQNIVAGDCLAKYVESLFIALSGAFINAPY